MLGSSLKWMDWCLSTTNVIGVVVDVGADAGGEAANEDRREAISSQLRSVRKPLVILEWSQRWGLNPRPTVYETVALPLSYFGLGDYSERIAAETGTPIQPPVACATTIESFL